MLRFAKPILVAAAVVLPMTSSAQVITTTPTFYGLSSRESYLYNDFEVTSPFIANLSGFSAGDVLHIKMQGRWMCNATCGPIPVSLIAIFSSSPAPLPSSFSDRVPGKVCTSQPGVVTPSTYWGGNSTDIACDFGISTLTFDIALPAGGDYLFVGFYDSYFADNAPYPLGDRLGVTMHVTAADPGVVPEPATFGLVGLGLIAAGFVARRRR